MPVEKTLDEIINDLETANKTIENLTEEKNKLAEENTNLTADNTKLAEENTNLAAEVAKLSAGEKTNQKAEPKKPSKPVVINGKKYNFAVPALRGNGGEIISAEVAALDEELMKSIVETEGQCILVQVK